MIKNFPANAREGSLTLGLGRSPGVGNDNPLHYSCLENSIDRGASVQFSSVSQSCLTLCNPWTAACHASLSITKSQFTPTHESVIPSNHLIPGRPLLLPLQSFTASGSFQMSQLFSSGGQRLGVSASASVLPMNIQD